MRISDWSSDVCSSDLGMDARRRLPPLVLEPTDKTGLRHLDAVISMAHGEDEDSANGNFSIMVGANRSLDAKGSYRGYAAFGKVVAGMDVVKRMLALPTGGGRGDRKSVGGGKSGEERVGAGG